MRGPARRVCAHLLTSLVASFLVGGCTTGTLSGAGAAPPETAEVAGSMLVRQAGEVIGPAAHDGRTDPRPQTDHADAASDTPRGPSAADLVAQRLPAGPARVGAFLGFGEHDVAIAGSVLRDASHGPIVVIDAVLSPEADTAWCQPTVRADAARSLEAVGTLRVELVLLGRDGARTRTPTEHLAVGVALEPGGHVALSPSRPLPIDPDELVEVRCVGAYTPA